MVTLDRHCTEKSWLETNDGKLTKSLVTKQYWSQNMFVPNKFPKNMLVQKDLVDISFSLRTFWKKIMLVKYKKHVWVDLVVDVIVEALGWSLHWCWLKLLIVLTTTTTWLFCVVKLVAG